MFPISRAAIFVDGTYWDKVRLELDRPDVDLVPAVEAAKDAGIIVKLLYARGSKTYAHDELIQVADERVQLTDEFLRPYLRPAAAATSGEG